MPLLGALEYGYLEVAHLLVGHGANIDAEDDEGRTAFQVASEYGYVRSPVHGSSIPIARLMLCLPSEGCRYIHFKKDSHRECGSARSVSGR